MSSPISLHQKRVLNISHHFRQLRTTFFLCARMHYPFTSELPRSLPDRGSLAPAPHLPPPRRSRSVLSHHRSCPRVLSSRHETGPSSHKRARVSSYADNGRTTYGGGGGVNAAEFLPAWQSSFSRSSGGRGALPPVTELPFIPAATKAAAVAAAAEGSYRGDRKGSRNGYRDPRSASPTPSYASSSTFSAATTTATALSSRASLSSCRSSFTSPAPSHSSHGGSGGGGGAGRRYGSGRASHRSSKGSSFSSRSSYLSSRQAPSATSDGCGGGDGSADFFPKPSSSWSGSRGGSGGGSVNRRRRGSPGGGDRRDGSRDRYVGSSRGREQQHGGSVDVLQPSIASASSRSSRDRRYGYPPSSRRSGGGGRKDYASEAGAGGRKRNRSSSREHGSGSCSSRKSTPESPSGVTCERCLEWCRYSRALQRRPITRTLQVNFLGGALHICCGCANLAFRNRFKCGDSFFSFSRSCILYVLRNVCTSDAGACFCCTSLAHSLACGKRRPAFSTS